MAESLPCCSGIGCAASGTWPSGKLREEMADASPRRPQQCTMPSCVPTHSRSASAGAAESLLALTTAHCVDAQTTDPPSDARNGARAARAAIAASSEVVARREHAASEADVEDSPGRRRSAKVSSSSSPPSKVHRSVGCRPSRYLRTSAAGGSASASSSLAAAGRRTMSAAVVVMHSAGPSASVCSATASKSETARRPRQTNCRASRSIRPNSNESSSAELKAAHGVCKPVASSFTTAKAHGVALAREEEMEKESCC